MIGPMKCASSASSSSDTSTDGTVAMLRVRLAHLVAEFTTVAEVAQYIDLAALVPDPRPRT
jgi:hypothetical protein